MGINGTLSCRKYVTANPFINIFSIFYSFYDKGGGGGGGGGDIYQLLLVP